MGRLEIVQLPQLRDNYGYLLVCTESGEAAVVDSPGAEAVASAVGERGVRLVGIWNTHHHWDHVGANDELLARWPELRVYGHRSDSGRIPGLTDPLEDGDRVRVGRHEARVLFVPGHTSGHIAYYLAEDGALFPGDTLFGAGCGRLFEGTPADMTHALLDVLGALPKDTLVYCAHEYTESNIRFALTVDPDNADLQARAEAARAARADGRPTVPFTLAEEWQTNPFMRVREPALRAAAARAGVEETADPVRVLAAIRRLKDDFRG